MVYTVSFEQPVVLWLLFALPLLVFTHLYFMHHAKKQAIRFANFETIQRVTGKKILTKNVLLLIVRCLVVGLLIASASGPTLWRETKENASDVVIVIDASASMAASDMDGPRIEAAKKAAQSFIQELNTAASISVVQFSGLAEVVQPPTIDENEVVNAINSVRIKAIGGTDLSGAIVTGSNLLSDSNKGKVILLITDGVSSVSLYDENPIEKAIAYAQDKHVVIHTIGVGTQSGSGFLPTVEAAAARLDEQNLQVIASSTGGVYAWAKSPEQLDAAFDAVITEGSTGFSPIELHYGLLFVALFIVFIEWGLINTRYRLLP